MITLKINKTYESILTIVMSLIGYGITNIYSPMYNSVWLISALIGLYCLWHWYPIEYKKEDNK